MSIFQQIFGTGSSADVKAIIEKGAFLVDVRTPAEFAEGHVKDSINIPLNTVAGQLEKFRGEDHRVVVCRSGNRSGQAKSILEKNGFTNVVNGGTWDYVNQFVK